MIAPGIAIGAAIVLALCLVRTFAGPTLCDRLLAANATAVKAALVAAAAAAAASRPDWIDAALALALALFVLNVAAAKFFRANTFQTPLARAEDRE